MSSSSYILGINESHNASAALFKDSQIIACVSEERFTRKKLQSGTPKNAIDYCLNFAGISFKDLAQVFISDIEPPFLDPKDSPYSRYRPPFPFYIRAFFDIEAKFPLFEKLFYYLYKKYIKFKLRGSRKNRLSNLQKIIPLPLAKFTFVNHHLCHGLAALFSSDFPKRKESCLVFTCDGVGDFESATISKFEDGNLIRLSTITFQHSIGFFYQHITQLLGLKPVEDEYKVMGLAPYAEKTKSKEVYKLLAPYFKINKSENKWEIAPPEYYLWNQLPKLLSYKRFDSIAGAAQEIIEEILSKWVENALDYYKMSNAVFGGGVFANVKVNQKIAQSSKIKQAFFMPSPGDESNAIGAACFYYLDKLVPTPVQNLYLGVGFSDYEIEDLLRQELKNKRSYSLKKEKNINATIAKLLFQGSVVARFVGRMEFGARTLGNRSILANPSNPKIVEWINSAIKKRDFWMPFAPTILRERAKDYLILHKADSPFMNVSFRVSKKGEKDLAAAIHPYDKTTRAQILDEKANPSYYDLIKKFEKLTGIGAVLNTSFNIHGEPIVATVQDAFRVFERSKLKYLAIGNFLVAKK
ncbi:hypothetical protein HY025_05125 [Candidatus Daviesbacteria bacterium]|nr:hypothetical protein [Candidatus Daviesbacteria bacterium]